MSNGDDDSVIIRNGATLEPPATDLTVGGVKAQKASVQDIRSTLHDVRNATTDTTQRQKLADAIDGCDSLKDLLQAVIDQAIVMHG